MNAICMALKFLLVAVAQFIYLLYKWYSAMHIVWFIVFRCSYKRDVDNVTANRYVWERECDRCIENPLGAFVGTFFSFFLSSKWWQFSNWTKFVLLVGILCVKLSTICFISIIHIVLWFPDFSFTTIFHLLDIGGSFQDSFLSLSLSRFFFYFTELRNSTYQSLPDLVFSFIWLSFNSRTVYKF